MAVKPLTEVYIEDVEKLIDDEKLMYALQDIAFLKKNNNGIGNEVLEDLENKVYEKVAAQFRDYLEKKEINKAAALYRSLATIGKTDLLPGWSYKRILFSIAGEEVEKGNRASAVMIYLKAMETEECDAEDFATMISLASEIGNTKAIKKISDVMNGLGIPVKKEYMELLSGKTTKAEMMNGTAIIWVDKGIKIEQGYGIPDRVLGSGFFVDSRGYMLTNHHVIESEVDPEYEGFSRLYIRLSKNVNERVPAKVVGYDRIFDLALLKVSITPDYVFYSAGDVEVEPGDKVNAIGAPLGLENTLTSGIISNVSRRFIQMGDVMQIDAPVNPGNSGGPLLDDNDNLVGVVFAGLEMFEGLNFAIPYNWVNMVFPGLFEEGEVIHPWLGLALAENEKGLEVIYTVPGEPAWRVGIQKGDIIESLDGSPFKSIRDIQEAILRFEPETLMKLSWKRGDSSVESIICLGKRPFSPIEYAIKRDIKENIIIPLFGMEIKAVKNFLWDTEYVVNRVYQGSIADNSGISENDPLSIQRWRLDMENRIAIIQVFVKKRKAGFFENIVQLAAYLETDNFL
ncbi:MAG: trypsin-like peptidase domain-containing protein [Spirochaetales bacterium]|nr:trypsin-like peptidase domain-containing protein [Spirochaetales bacterium]